MRKSCATVPPPVPGTDCFYAGSLAASLPAGAPLRVPPGIGRPLRRERACHANKPPSLHTRSLVLPASVGPFPVSPVAQPGALQRAPGRRRIACPALPRYRVPRPQPRGTLGTGRRGHPRVFRFLKASARVSAASPLLAVGLRPPSPPPCGVPALRLPGRVAVGPLSPRTTLLPARLPREPRHGRGRSLARCLPQWQGSPGLLGGTRPQPGRGRVEGHPEPGSPQRCEQGGGAAAAAAAGIPPALTALFAFLCACQRRGVPRSWHGQKHVARSAGDA